jgi:ribosomal protein L10
MTPLILQLLNEVDKLNKLKRHKVAPIVFEMVEMKGGWVLVLSLIPGENLQKLASRDETLTPFELKALIIGLLNALKICEDEVGLCLKRSHLKLEHRPHLACHRHHTLV